MRYLRLTGRWSFDPSMILRKDIDMFIRASPFDAIPELERWQLSPRRNSLRASKSQSAVLLAFSSCSSTTSALRFLPIAFEMAPTASKAARATCQPQKAWLSWDEA
jgi:hypothetical protein